METLERLQNQLGSLQQLHSIVGTMKSLSAASIRQYELAEHAVDQYFRTVELGFQVLLRDAPLPALDQAAKTATRGAIVFGSDHGLCGRFNDDVVNYAVAQLGQQSARLLAVGHRAAALLEQQALPAEACIQLPATAEAIPATVKMLLRRLNDWRQHKCINHVFMCYNERSHTGMHQPVATQLLPIDPAFFAMLGKRPWRSRSLPTYSMDRETLFSGLIQQYLFVVILRACARSIASEHASRLLRMQAAEKNLDSRIEEVRGKSLRARQLGITSELLDVIGGYEALTTNKA